ncbi:MAG: hypothetical protein LLF94_02500 [Chlamydiales bacterium]|nr:hypothetical protein [Chlamydiales bacterium]
MSEVSFHSEHSPTYHSNVDKKPVNPELQKFAPRVVAALKKAGFEVDIDNITIVGVGKDKIIALINRSNDFDPTEVVKVARQSLLNIRERRIGNESQVGEAAKKNPLVDTTNLDIGTETVGKGAWRAPKLGGGTLDDLKRSDFTDPTRAKSYCKQLVNGIKSTHLLGFTHNDIKPDNLFLSDDKKTLKVADWGKAEMVGVNQLGSPYSGNTRYGRDSHNSQPNDVHATALCLMDILGRKFIDEGQSLVSVHMDTKKTPPADKSRTGVQKFLLDFPAFTRTYETKGTFLGKVQDFKARIATFLGIDSDKGGKETWAMNRYIKAVGKNLEQSGDLTSDKARTLEVLLRAMTAKDPNMRPNIELVEKVMDFIFSDKTPDSVSPFLKLLIQNEGAQKSSGWTIVSQIKPSLEEMFKDYKL